MCGIFGIALSQEAELSRREFEVLLEKLYLLSESRGKESAGLHIHLPTAAKAWTIKGAKPASELLKTNDFRVTLKSALNLAYTDNSEKPVQPIIAIAHSRLVTNGGAERPENNQPVRFQSVTVIHNGIVVNVDELWRAHPHLHRHAEVDTEVIAATLAEAMDRDINPLSATRSAFSELKGAASIAWTHAATSTLTLATNTGDLFVAMLPESSGVIFASERYILESAIGVLGDLSSEVMPEPIQPGRGVMIDVAGANRVFDVGLFGDDLAVDYGRVEKRKPSEQFDVIGSGVPTFIPVSPVLKPADESLLRYNEQAMRAIKRCSCCVLPETFPFIMFDDKGVCNYCRGYKPKWKGLVPDTAKKSFIDSIQRYRSQNGQPDVIVPFSGGRDSCYGLHLIKKEFGLNPITFTYDWGMVTDLARRNIARFCGELGVQNILVSADIKVKRENIRKNVSAWLRRPDLGMVPLFMAGDKHFFSILNELKKQTGIGLNIWSANPLENTDFKVGLCGVAPEFDKQRVDSLSILNKCKLLFYYGRGFLLNPGMLNSSLKDTASAFSSYYFEPRDDFFSLFHHLVWDESIVNEIIVSEYGFEHATDSPSTWRIGDGTAPFYNYIYMTANGFSEFDTFRSNQIREGQLSRSEALEYIIVENRPRVEGLRWYFDVLGLDFNDVIKTVNKLDVCGLHS